MNIYDCFTYNNEELVLGLRLKYLNKYVKKFIIVEAKQTHQGQIKKHTLNLNKLKEFSNKIDYHLIEKFPENLSNWGRENFQRNFHSNLIKHLDEDDYIMISDLDEIPNLNNLNNLDNFKYTVFEQKNYAYKINLINTTYPNWYGTRICKKKIFKITSMVKRSKNKKIFFF